MNLRLVWYPKSLLTLLPVGILAVVAIARYAQGIVTNEIAAVTNGISDPP